MNTSVSLDSVRVDAMMTRDVVEVECNQSMCCAATMLSRRGVSAAPVVDEHGRCVGMLTGADFIQRECEHGEATEFHLGAREYEVIKGESCEPLRMESHPEDRVRYHMSPTVQSVSADSSLSHAARVMHRGRVHHLVVLDHHERPIGMLSMSDVVAAVLGEGDSDGV